MSEMPNIAILFLTYRRTDRALRTIKSTFENMIYPKEKIGIYIADDGSDTKHAESVFSEVEKYNVRIIGSHNERMRRPGQENTHNSGIGWNKGLGICHQYSDFVLVEEDDWELDEPLDLVPYVKLLQDNEQVGICSFRILSEGADVHTIGYGGRMYLKYHRNTQYAYSGNPYLRHARYTKHYGWFAEDRNPGLIELHQDDQYRLAVGDAPEIWRPADISVWGAFKHIGQEKTWE